LEESTDDNNRKAWDPSRYVVSWMAIHQARTEAVPDEIINKTDAHQERMEASTNAWWKETMACQEATEGYLEKPKANQE
jgi:hypothetical protein